MISRRWIGGLIGSSEGGGGLRVSAAPQSVSNSRSRFIVCYEGVTDFPKIDQTPSKSEA